MRFSVLLVVLSVGFSPACDREDGRREGSVVERESPALDAASKEAPQRATDLQADAVASSFGADTAATSATGAARASVMASAREVVTRLAVEPVEARDLLPWDLWRVGHARLATHLRISDIAALPDGDIVAHTGTTLATWSTKEGRFGQSSSEVAGPVSFAVDITPDGDTAVLAKGGLTWLSRGEGVVHTIQTDTSNIQLLRTDEEAHVVVARTFQGELVGWTRDGTQPSWVLEDVSGRKPHTPALSPQGTFVAVPTGEEVTILGARGGRVLGKAAAPGKVAHFLGEDMLAVGGDDGIVRIVSVPGGALLRPVRIGDSAVVALASDADHDRLGIGTEDGWVTLWDLAADASIGTWLTGPPATLALPPAGDWVAAMFGRNVRVLDPGDPKRDRVAFPGRAVEEAVVTPEEALLTRDEAGNVLVWDTESGMASASLQGDTGIAALAPDGSAIAIAHGGAMHVYDSDLLEVVMSIPLAEPLDRYDAEPAFSPDGTWLAIPDAANGDEIVHLYEVETGRLVGSSEVDDLASIRFAPDGGSVAIVEDTRLRVLSCPDLELVLENPIGEFEDAVLAYAPDGRHVVTLDAEHVVETHSLETAASPPTAAPVGSFAVDDELESLLLVSGDGPVITSELDGPTQARSPSGAVLWRSEGLDPMTLWTAPDGHTSLVSINNYGALRVLDPTTGELLRALDSDDILEPLGLSREVLISEEGSTIRGRQLIDIPTVTRLPESLSLVEAPDEPEPRLRPDVVDPRVERLVAALELPPDAVSARIAASTELGLGGTPRLMAVFDEVPLFALRDLSPATCASPPRTAEQWVVFSGEAALALALDEEAASAWVRDTEQDCLATVGHWTGVAPLDFSDRVGVELSHEGYDGPDILPEVHSWPLVEGEADLLLLHGELGVELQTVGGDTLLELGDGVTNGREGYVESVEDEEESTELTSTLAIGSDLEGVVLSVTVEEKVEQRFSTSHVSSTSTILLRGRDAEGEADIVELGEEQHEVLEDGGEFTDESSDTSIRVVHLVGPTGHVIVEVSESSSSYQQDECQLQEEFADEPDFEPDPCCGYQSESTSREVTWSFRGDDGDEAILYEAPEESESSTDPPECE